MWNHASFVCLVVFLTPWKIWVRQLGWWLIPTDQSCSSHQPVVFPYIISSRYCFIISICIYIYIYYIYIYFISSMDIIGTVRTHPGRPARAHQWGKHGRRGCSLAAGLREGKFNQRTPKHSHEAKQNRLRNRNNHYQIIIMWLFINIDMVDVH